MDLRINPFSRPVETQATGALEPLRAEAKAIGKVWSASPPHELAERIVRFEQRVACLDAAAPGVGKIRRVAEGLHFQFVFPVVLDMPRFARAIHKLAKQVIETSHGFESLNQTQQQEVLRYAGRGA